MRQIPKDKAGQLAYCKAHLPVWTAHAEAIGSSPELVAELADLTAEAEAAVFEQQCIEQQMKAATLRARMALKRMHRKASLIIRQVRVAAAPAGNEHIYVLAHVPPMKQKSRLGPPGLPMDLRFTLQATGELTLRWKCINPPGSRSTMYHISRKVDGGEFQYLGCVGKRMYEDNTLPTGAAQITYQIQAARSKRMGPIARFPIFIGTASDGKVTFMPKSRRVV